MMVKLPIPGARPLEHALAALVLFYGAMVLCLPVAHSEEIAATYPWWATRIASGNVLLHEVVFAAWIALTGWRFVMHGLLNKGVPARQAALWLIALALWCGTISLAAPLADQDLGRTLRLLLNAALLLAVVRWSRQTGIFSLSILVLGFLVGTVINLVISFENPFIVNEVMRLSGQNTPGVAMGVAIHLSAWLFVCTGRRVFQALALASALVFAFGCAISYSRIAWFTGALGGLAWLYVLLVAQPRGDGERMLLNKARRQWGPLLVLGLATFSISPAGQQNLQWIYTLVEQKFSPESGVDESSTYRASYAIGVAEILGKHPLGVGYSGFFDAMTATQIYRSGRASEEVDYEANPHSAFLYYASAGGIPGGIVAVLVFIMLLNSMRWGLTVTFGRTGSVFFSLAVPSYLLIGLTVPYLLNSIILIVPTAIVAGWGWRQRAGQAISTQSAIDYQYANKTLRSSGTPPALS